MYNLETASNDFFTHCKVEKNLSPKTLKAYQIDLKQLQKFLLERDYSMDLSKISKVEIREYLGEISNLKPKSIKRKIATIRAMFNYLEFEDKITVSPLRKMRIRLKEPKVLPRSLSINEVLEIFKRAYANKKNATKLSKYQKLEALRNIVVVELLFGTGARVSEIANLKDENVDIPQGTIILKGKGSKERVIQICNVEALKALAAYRKAFNKQISKAQNYFLINRFGSKLSDQSIRIIIKNLTTQASLSKHVTPHWFRHSFGTLLLENDVDIKYIQLLLGHSSITTTQIYTHVNKEKQKQILETRHPRKTFSMN
jgi:integrase/recombinase XerD